MGMVENGLMILLGPIASMIWHNEEYALGLGKDIALDGVICVVDAVFGKQVGSSHTSPLSLLTSTPLANGRGFFVRRFRARRKSAVSVS